MMNIFQSLGPWSWLILAVLLFALETIVPGIHFAWFGAAAVVVGLLALATPMGWPLQLVLFALLAMASAIFARRYARPEAVKSDLPDLNARGAQYVGRVVTVEEAIAGGRGKVRVGDTIWQAQGADATAGARVKVTGTNGTVLVVERDAG